MVVRETKLLFDTFCVACLLVVNIFMGLPVYELLSYHLLIIAYNVKILLAEVRNANC